MKAVVSALGFVTLLALSPAAVAGPGDDCDPAAKAVTGECPVLAPDPSPKDASDDQLNPAKYSRKDCSYIRLDYPGRLDGTTGKVDDSVTAMAHVGVLDQGPTGLCYAYTAAELTDAWRFSHGETNYDFRTSPLYSAVQAVRSGRRTQGAELNAVHEINSPFYIEDVLRFNHDVDICDSRATFNTASVSEMVASLDLVEKYFDAYHDFKRAQLVQEEPNPFLLSLLTDSPDIDKRFGSVQRSYLSGLLACLQSRGNSKSSLPSVDSLQAFFHGENSGEFIGALLFSACAAPHRSERVVSMPEPKIFRDLAKPASDFRAQIDALLDKPLPQPIAINYCQEVIYQGIGYKGIDRQAGSFLKGCNVHVSALIGRRFNPAKNRCEFLVQNTWGTDCFTSKNKPLFNDDWECKDGKVWIDQGALTRNVQQLTYLE